MTGLYAAFKNLSGAKISGEFNAISLGTRRKDFLAKNDDGAPVFLLHDSSAAKYIPSISFRYLSVQYHTTCSVNINEVNLIDQFCIVRCDSSSPDLYELFINCISAAIESIPEDAGTKELELFISKLRDLFRSLSQPATREVSGLWAELFVIQKSTNPSAALELWHADKYDKFDFSSSTIRVEVKSTVSQIRAHEFGLEQLQPTIEGIGYVVSLKLQSITGGLGVIDLAKIIESSITNLPKLKLKLWENIAKALGEDFSKKLDISFDQTYASQNIAIFLMDDIPKPERPKDTRVTSIRFVSDLSSLAPAKSKETTIRLADIFGSIN